MIDFWSLGAMMWMMLVGERPFEDDYVCFFGGPGPFLLSPNSLNPAPLDRDRGGPVQQYPPHADRAAQVAVQGSH